MERLALLHLEMQIARGLEAHALAPEQVEEAFALCAVPMRLDRGEAGRGRDFASKPRDDCRVGSVALARQRKRAVEVGLDMRRLRQQPRLVEPDGEAPRRDHRAHCMRAGRTDTDLEKFEQADRHGGAIGASRSSG